MTVHLPNTQIKTCLLVLWFNCELKIETGNKKLKRNAPPIHDFRLNFPKQNTMYFFFPKEGKELTSKTLEVYIVKNTRGV